MDNYDLVQLLHDIITKEKFYISAYHANRKSDTILLDISTQFFVR